MKETADTIGVLERAEVVAARELRSAGIALEQAETRLAAARTARDEASAT